MPIRTGVAWRPRRRRTAAPRTEAARARAVFLSPHNDDETLFGAFTLLRDRPHVIVCLKSIVQEVSGYGITARQRERETAAALRVLGIPTWTQWEIPDAEPDWELLESRLKTLRAEKVYAPAFEDEGHAHHNTIAEIAARVFPADDLTAYMTYTHDGRSASPNLVPFESEWIALKLRALLCYKSQILERSTRDHFLYRQYEYYA